MLCVVCDNAFIFLVYLIAGGIVFGALISKVTTLIDKRNPQAKAYKEKMDEVKAFLDDKAFSGELKQKTRVSTVLDCVMSCF